VVGRLRDREPSRYAELVLEGVPSAIDEGDQTLQLRPK
jgi:hypothetical protein